MRIESRKSRAVRRLRKILVGGDASTAASEEIVDACMLRVSEARQDDEKEEGRKGKVVGHASGA